MEVLKTRVNPSLLVFIAVLTVGLLRSITALAGEAIKTGQRPANSPSKHNKKGDWKIKRTLFGAALAALVIASTLTGHAQELTGPPADPQYKYSTAMTPGIASPAEVQTRLGTLHFDSGIPDEATTDTLYDNLDFQHAVQAYLLGIPAVNQVSDRAAMLSTGPANVTVPIWEQLVDSRTVGLTFNDNTPYTWFWVDLRQGPLVIEVPPKVLGLINDIWYYWVADVGITGADKGRGGKYLLLPPGYKGEVPAGYFAVRAQTYSNVVIWRSFLVDGSPKQGVDAVKKLMKIYPLSQAASPPELKFVDLSGKPFNMVQPADYRFWEMLNEVVQSELTEEIDATTLGFWASIGIQKGKPFAPDARMKKILTEAAAVGDGTARAMFLRWRGREGYFYDNANWRLAFVGGYKFEWQPGVANLNARSMFFFAATGVTPAMDTKIVGEGSTYPWTSLDSNNHPLDGGKNYKLHLPGPIPVKTFWSVIVYSDQTRSFVQTDQQFPSVSSQKKDLIVNADGSVDVYFGPKPPRGKEPNWVQTIPGQSWFTLLRLYGPLEPWFDQTWRPGEIEAQP